MWSKWSRLYSAENLGWNKNFLVCQLIQQTFLHKFLWAWCVNLLSKFTLFWIHNRLLNAHNVALSEPWVTESYASIGWHHLNIVAHHTYILYIWRILACSIDLILVCVTAVSRFYHCPVFTEVSCGLYTVKQEHSIDSNHFSFSICEMLFFLRELICLVK